MIVENKREQSIYKKIGIYLFGIFLLLLPLILLKITGTKIVFYNNDDLYMQEICSGVMTGTPDAHAIFIGYLTGLGLSGLYTLFPTVPWYGFWLFFCLYGSIVYIVCRLATFLKENKNRFYFFIGGSLIIWMCLLQHVIELQFTTVTATVATAGLVSFICSKNCENIGKFLKQNIVSLLFFAVAFELRYNACLMILLVCGIFAIIKVMKNKKMFPAVMTYMGVLLTSILLLWSVEKIAYSGENWQDYQHYTVARANLLDYKGYPDYDTYENEYQKLGISKTAYEAAKYRYQLLLEENIDAKAFEYLDTLETKEQNVKVLLKDFIKLQHFSTADYPLNLVVYFLYAGSVILLLASHNGKYLWEVLGLFFGRNAIWAYLVLGGRIVPWVTQGIYIMEAMVLVSILIRNQVWKHLGTAEAKKYRNVLLAVMIAGLLVCTFTGIPNTNKMIAQNKVRQNDVNAYAAVRNYCDAHADKLYLVDLLSGHAFNDYALDATITSSGNMVLLGGWPSNSPWTDTIAQKYSIDSYLEAIANMENVYFIFKDSAATNYEYLELYLTDKGIDGQLTVDDVVTSDNGEKFLILKMGNT